MDKKWKVFMLKKRTERKGHLQDNLAASPGLVKKEFEKYIWVLPIFYTGLHNMPVFWQSVRIFNYLFG